MIARQWVPVFVLVALVSTAAGCQNTDLELDDRGRFTPGGRVSYEIWPGIEKRRTGSALELVTGTPEELGAPAPVEPVTMESAGVVPTIAIDGSIAAVKGSDHQRIEAGEQVELDQTVLGPARLELDSENIRGHVAARGGVRFFDVLSLEAITGVGIDSTELRLRSGDVDTSDEDLRVGFLVGGRITVRPIALFDLYAQSVTNFVGSLRYIRDSEVGVELNLTRNLAVFAGYRWWRYFEDASSGSDWELDIRGPTAGGSLKF